MFCRKLVQRSWQESFSPHHCVGLLFFYCQLVHSRLLLLLLLLASLPFTHNNFATHTHATLSHTILSRTQLSHTGVAFGDIHAHFVWQAWHLVTSMWLLCGRRGTQLRHWLWWHALVGIDAGDAVVLCVAGVAVSDIDVTSVWQAWCLVTLTSLLCGRRCVW